MTLASTEIAQLNSVIAALKKIVVQHSKSGNGATNRPTPKKSQRRFRRSGKELVAFRKMLIAERKKGVAVAALAKRHGISASYIYQL